MFSVYYIAFCTGIKLPYNGITLIFFLTSKFNIKVFIAQEAVPIFLANISTYFILINI